VRIKTSENKDLTDKTNVSDIIPLKFLRRGKVRDIYEVDADHLLFVATDRISAFDCILPTNIPHKGEVLTRISSFWFGRTSHLVPNHLVCDRVEDFPADLLSMLTNQARAYLSNRSMLIRRAEVIPFECVVRGYLAGSGWKEYLQSGTICGRSLPPGLRQADQLPQPIFTPATKAESGHDINVPIETMAANIGADLTHQLEAVSLAIYREAADYAASRGIIIADTKFEFGLRNGRIILIDELLTPDSSRFWPAQSYSAGGPQPSFDKQSVRDYLETLDWNKMPPAPPLPPEIITATSQRYLEAFRLITGLHLFRQT